MARVTQATQTPPTLAESGHYIVQFFGAATNLNIEGTRALLEGVREKHGDDTVAFLIMSRIPNLGETNYSGTIFDILAGTSPHMKVWTEDLSAKELALIKLLVSELNRCGAEWETITGSKHPDSDERKLTPGEQLLTNVLIEGGVMLFSAEGAKPLPANIARGSVGAKA